jgi:hypothetical protein
MTLVPLTLCIIGSIRRETFSFKNTENPDAPISAGSLISPHFSSML